MAPRTFYYNDYGRLISWTDFNNPPVQMAKQYDGNGFVQWVEDGNLHITSFINEPKVGNITTVTLPQHDADDVEPTGTEPLDTIIHYAYTNALEPYYLQSTTNARGYQ